MSYPPSRPSLESVYNKLRLKKLDPSLVVEAMRAFPKGETRRHRLAILSRAIAPRLAWSARIADLIRSRPQDLGASSGEGVADYFPGEVRRLLSKFDAQSKSLSITGAALTAAIDDERIGELAEPFWLVGLAVGSLDELIERLRSQAQLPWREIAVLYVTKLPDSENYWDDVATAMGKLKRRHSRWQTRDTKPRKRSKRRPG